MLKTTMNLLVWEYAEVFLTQDRRGLLNSKMLAMNAKTTTTTTTMVAAAPNQETLVGYEWRRCKRPNRRGWRK